MKNTSGKKRKILVFVILALLLISAVSIYGYMYLKEKIIICQCQHRLKSLGLSLIQYAMDNEDYFPDKDNAEGLNKLIKESYLGDSVLFICPAVSRRKPGPVELPEEEISYCYRAGLKYSGDSTSPIAWDKPGNHKNYGNVLLANGLVISYKGHDWMKNIEKPARRKPDSR